MIGLSDAVKRDEIDRNREAVLGITINQPLLLVPHSFEVSGCNQSVTKLMEMSPVANGKSEVYVDCGSAGGHTPDIHEQRISGRGASEEEGDVETDRDAINDANNPKQIFRKWSQRPQGPV